VFKRGKQDTMCNSQLESVKTTTQNHEKQLVTIHQTVRPVCVRQCESDLINSECINPMGLDNSLH